MEKIPTLKEWSSLKFNGEMSYNKTDMIEFAKLHVQQALKEASEKALMEEDWVWDGEEENHVYTGVNKDSILKSYPLENIK